MALVHIPTFKYSFAKSFYCPIMNTLYTNVWLNIKKDHHLKLIIKCVMKRTHWTRHHKMFIWFNIVTQSANLFLFCIHFCIWFFCILFPYVIIHIKIWISQFFSNYSSQRCLSASGRANNHNSCWHIFPLIHNYFYHIMFSPQIASSFFSSIDFFHQEGDLPPSKTY